MRLRQKAGLIRSRVQQRWRQDKVETSIYLIRHAESRYIPEDDNYSRPLSLKGKEDAESLTQYFGDFKITRVLSSPYLRASHTVEGIAEDKNLKIELIDDVRERTVADQYLDEKEFMEFVKCQWDDFDYSLEGGESLGQVQARGIKALKDIIKLYAGESIILGTHGTWLAVILNYFDEKYDYNFWKTLKMPDIFLLSFKGENLKYIKHMKVSS